MGTVDWEFFCKKILVNHYQQHKFKRWSIFLDE